MNGVRLGHLGPPAQVVDREIALPRPERALIAEAPADAIGSARLEAMQRELVLHGIERDRAHAEFGGGPENANGDLAAIGDEQAGQLDHEIPLLALSRLFRNFHTASQQRPIRSYFEHQRGHEEGVKADDDPVALIYAVRGGDSGDRGLRLEILMRGGGMRCPGFRTFGLVWLFGLLAMSSPALALGDCPLVGTLENFSASQAPRITTYDAEEFRVIDGKQAKTVVKKGKICTHDYDRKSGVAKMSGLEIMQNYAEGLPAEGMTITNADRANDDDVYATVKKGSTEYWVHVWESNGDGVHVHVLQVTPFQAKIVAAGSADCPLVPVQQNFQTSDKPRLRTFDEEEFLVIEGDQQKSVKKTGGVCKQDYVLKPGVSKMSGLEIMQNYAEALPAAGLKITNAKRNPDDDVYATITKDGTTYWAHVSESNGDGLHILVLQDTPFHAHLTPPGADDCPIIPVQQNFQIASNRYARAYDVEEFRDGDKVVKKYGKICERDYDVKPGIAKMSALEIMRNYAEAAASTGYAITNSHRNPDDDIYASMAKDGASYWFHIWETNGDGLHILALQEAPFRSSLAALTAKDCPLAPALENFQAAGPPQANKFDAMDFQIVEGEQNKVVTKKGKVCRQDYLLKSGVTTMSALEIMLNYAEGLPAE